MKILHINPSLDKVRGGPSEVVVNTAYFHNTSTENGLYILSTFSEKPGFELVDYSKVKEKVYLLPRKKFLFYEQYVPSLKKWLINNILNYDLIHIHSVFNYTSHISMTCARLMGVPYVLTPHGMLGEYDLKRKRILKKIWLKFIDDKNLNFVSAFHATANIEKLGLSKMFPVSRVDVIPYGINIPSLPFETVKKEKKLNIVFISRLHKKKNLPGVLQAISKALKNGISLNLRIAGEPNPGEENYKVYLQKMVQDLNIDKHVEFCGFLSGQAKEELFKWADVFMLPSFDENFGVAVLEALSYSVPVIISPQVALSKEVREFGGGWITDEANPQSPDSILKILVLINQNKNLILEESKKARLVAERFSWENYGKSLNILYRSILDKK
jgi:glycosyltransferase involved in cell wall biosynthesis